MSMVTTRSADAVPAADLHAAFGAAFADYLIGPFQVPLAGWPVFLARQAADLGLSRVAELDGQIVAFALVAPRPQVLRWRLATMGALPAARGSGAAPALLDDFVDRAGAAGQLGVELEVFAQNQRAVRLYRGRGFEVRHALHGYALQPGRAAGRAPAVTEVDRGSAMSWLAQAMVQLPDLPLQVTPAVLQALPQQVQAWQHGQAQLVFGMPADAALVIHSLVDRDPAQRDAHVLLEALLARHPQRAIQVPQLQRLDVGGQALRRLGFEPQPLHQLWMCRALAV